MNTMKTCCLNIIVCSLLVGMACAGDPPNFIIFYTDDQGWADTSVSMMDNEPLSRSDFYKTPALERLAARGVLANLIECIAFQTEFKHSLFERREDREYLFNFIGDGHHVLGLGSLGVVLLKPFDRLFVLRADLLAIDSPLAGLMAGDLAVQLVERN